MSFTQDNIEKTDNILKIINDTADIGTKSLESLDNQYEQLQKINKLTDNINQTLDTTSSLLGRIRYFFFPRNITEIKHFSDDINYNKLKDININNNIEDKNIKDINTGIANLKNIALNMSDALDRDKIMLDKVNLKSEIVDSNMKKINTEITKLL